MLSSRAARLVVDHQRCGDAGYFFQAPIGAHSSAPLEAVPMF